MTDAVNRATYPVLLLASAADLVHELLFEAAQVDADARISRFVFDAAQAYRAEDARTALSRGYERTPYTVLMVGGDVAASMTRRELEALVAASLNPAELLVVGLWRDQREAAALANLGITRACAMHVFRLEFAGIVQAAAQDLRTRREAAAASAATGGTRIIINQSPRDGLLRDSGIITFHSTKGGSGKTTLSTNVAWALSSTGRSTVLVDLNADGANCHSHLMRAIKKAEGIDEIDQLFESRGLSLLAHRMRHDVAYGAIAPQDLKAALVRLTDSLSFLPGVRDQSDYQAGVAGGDQAVMQLLRSPRWVEDMLNQLSAAGTGHSFVVVDTGTARYTGPGFAAIARCNLLVLVVNASMPSNLAADITAAEEMIASTVAPLHCRKMLIANQLQRDVPGAPTLSDVQRRFEFFRADRVMPLHADWHALTVANVKGIPYLSDPRNFDTPLGREMLAIVNAISDTIRLDGSSPGGRKGGLFGGLFGGKG